ncbi:MAG: nickel pincer cofactor biosynthesis protein LarC [bacterium]
MGKILKTAYFDCFAGASGDMILGALIDAGLDIDILRKELKKLKLTGYSLRAEKAVKKGIAGTKFSVDVTHDHEHRTLRDIVGIIDKSTLFEKIKTDSGMIFRSLAEAEAKIHDKPVDKIHFHEVGAVDSIIDIVGVVIGLDVMGVQKVRASRIHVGTGRLKCAHGTLPVPPPATLELLKNILIYSTGIESELVTPTGAAILSTLSENFGGLPSIRIERSGYGLGRKDLDIPNVLRVIVGEEESSANQDTVQLIETNIDDMNPQFYEHIMESLFAHGAKDVFLTPVIMKKNRPGVVLSVLASPEKISDLTDVIFRETTTLGVRISEIKKRSILEREIKTVSTPWGDARVKIREFHGKKMVAPEYEDCKRLAQEHGLPIREVFDFVKKEGEKDLGK